MRPEKLLRLSADLSFKSEAGSIEIKSNKEAVSVSLSSFSALRNIPISYRHAYALLRRASGAVNQVIVVQHQNKTLFKMKAGKAHSRNFFGLLKFWLA